MSALVNGSNDPSVPFDAAAVMSIGAIEDGSGELLCSGILIAERWVLTARHCVFDGIFAGLAFRTESAGAELLLPVTAHFAHENLDALLLEIPPSSGLTPGSVHPLELSDASATLVGKKAIMAGFGRKVDGSYGDRQFSDTRIVEIGAQAIVVDSGSEHGACGGDSGGPLIDIAADGSPTVIGILTEGSASCRGKDVYLRVDQLRPWIHEIQRQRLADPCGGVSWEGICHDGQQPTWCAGDHLETSTCTNHELCGWSTDVLGYRCVEGDSDPCFGAGPEGYCVSDTLRRCDRGRLVEVDCSSCGQVCGKQAEGRAACSP